MIPSRDDAVRAAVEVGHRHGVHCAEPAVLADGFNVVVWLRPAPVVARVVLLPALLRLRVDEMISRELAVAAFLAERGVPVVRPTDQLPSGPHQHRGLWMSFWEHVEVQPGFADATEFVENLLALHAALREYEPGGVALDVVTGDIEQFLRTGGEHTDVSAMELQTLRAEFDRLVPLVSDHGHLRQVHGDTHAGNLLRTKGGWVWTDFEETMSAPIEWDLACLYESTRIDSAAAVRRYGGVDEQALRPFRDLRTLQRTVWLLILARWDPECAAEAHAMLRGLNPEAHT